MNIICLMIIIKLLLNLKLKFIHYLLYINNNIYIYPFLILNNKNNTIYLGFILFKIKILILY